MGIESKEGINSQYKLAVKYGYWTYGSTPGHAYMKWDEWVVTGPFNRVALRGKVPSHTVSRLPQIFLLLEQRGPGVRLTLSAGTGFGTGRFCKAILLRLA